MGSTTKNDLLKRRRHVVPPQQNQFYLFCYVFRNLFPWKWADFSFCEPLPLGAGICLFCLKSLPLGASAFLSLPPAPTSWPQAFFFVWLSSKIVNNDENKPDALL